MKIHPQLTDEAILQELGARLAAERLNLNLTQAALAASAGVSKRTVERLEGGQVATQLSGFLRVCRVLGLVERLDALIPPPTPSPIAQLKLQGRRRQRATGRRGAAARSDVVEEPRHWTWGE
jgi:transcriptional regulator with XRE-family HTH domain